MKPGHDAAPSQPTVWNIQALRGLAALMVLWNHLKFPATFLLAHYKMPSVLYTGWGAGGVDLFFVISGYVISLTAGLKHHGPRDFIAARIARIVPLYLVLTVFCIAVKALTPGLQLSFRSLWNGLFYLPLFDFGDYTPPPIDAGWTLSFEMWFYLVFALLLNFWKPRRVALILPFLFLAGALLMTFYQGGWIFPRFMFHPFVLEFAFGCLVFFTQKWVTGWRPLLLLLAAPAWLLLFAGNSDYLGWDEVMFRDQAGVILAWKRVLLWGVPAALLVAGLVGRERTRGYILPNVLVWVGAFSYSLYLVHRLVEMALIRGGSHFDFAREQPLLIFATMLTMSLFLSWLSYLYLERPLTRWAQRLLKTKSTPPGLTAGPEPQHS